MGRVTVRDKVWRIKGAESGERLDSLVVEEPLEVRLGGRALAVTMRTPGHDFELATGFLVSEGVVTEAEQVHSIRYCAGATDDGSNTYNVLDVVLAPGVTVPELSLERNFYTTSSCGVCGKASLEAVRTIARFPVDGDPVRFSTSVLAALPDRLREAQRVFERTGGLHAAALVTPEGELLAVREDVGRHNAVDKLVGWATRERGLPLSGTGLLVSGRASFELAQKALMAGIPLLAAVSAPSSLAVELAADSGLSLVGFLRGESMNVYAGRERVFVG
ncbi:formate dehydrogenase accessory sulfurtransferase FdhD [Nocardiopsis ansamitocini]|uniref:Sulfur carrier protein FdhD n=1 Tax=Nocardiopsis ansamitocini TaxID=1670832 RepID=A0A9W6P7T5_9ACTN|nr:formate dehydrogenase accessory sulfurtransferase FdhD [Nocardiopsis ansamitocini]GLU48578.1 sulfurtransferase FdhD [Nocardiopsis ansamitocini]